MLRRMFIACAAILTASAFITVSAQSDCDGECRRLLGAARAGTAKYHQVQRALDAGYVPMGPCVESPAGAMGIHYVSVARVVDPTLDPADPEVLLYMPDAKGKLRLVAVEYSRLNVLPRPSLFGQEFDASFFLTPPQYTLHVWLWKNNPEGIFAEFNPELSCPE